MNKINKNEQGFSVVEILLVLLTLAIIGVAGYFVAKHVDTKKTATNAIASAPNKPANPDIPAKPANPYAGWQTYTSTDQTYSVEYPSDWVGASCAASNACKTDDGPFDNVLSPSAEADWQVVQLQHSASNLSAKGWFTQNVYQTPSIVDLSNVSTTKINGYDTYTADTKENSASGNTASNIANSEMGYYVFSHSGTVFEMSMPIQSTSQDPDLRNTAPLVPTFQKIAASVKFLN